MNKKGVAVLLSALMLSGILTGCGDDPEQLPDSPQIQQTDPVRDESEGTTANLNICTVSTPYGDLYYQEQWSEFMRPEVEQRQEAVEVTFRAEVNGKLYRLFAVTIGEGEGDPVCQLTDGQGTRRNVYVEMEEFLDVSGLDEGNEKMLYAMQEDINFVIENIK